MSQWDPFLTGTVNLSKQDYFEIVRKRNNSDDQPYTLEFTVWIPQSGREDLHSRVAEVVVAQIQ